MKTDNKNSIIEIYLACCLLKANANFVNEKLQSMRSENEYQWDLVYLADLISVILSQFESKNPALLELDFDEYAKESYQEMKTVYEEFEVKDYLYCSVKKFDQEINENVRLLNQDDRTEIASNFHKINSALLPTITNRLIQDCPGRKYVADENFED